MHPYTLKTPQLNVLRSAEVCVCISEYVCAGEGVVCIQASRDPDWPPPNWSGSGSGFSEKDLPKHSRRPNVCHLFCFDLGSSVIVCALKNLLLFQLTSNCNL